MATDSCSKSSFCLQAPPNLAASHSVQQQLKGAMQWVGGVWGSTCRRKQGHVQQPIQQAVAFCCAGAFSHEKGGGWGEQGREEVDEEGAKKKSQLI